MAERVSSTHLPTAGDDPVVSEIEKGAIPLTVWLQSLILTDHFTLNYRLGGAPIPAQEQSCRFISLGKLRRSNHGYGGRSQPVKTAIIKFSTVQIMQ